MTIFKSHRALNKVKYRINGIFKQTVIPTKITKYNILLNMLTKAKIYMYKIVNKLPRIFSCLVDHS